MDEAHVNQVIKKNNDILIKPLVEKWKGEGKSTILLLDDGLGAVQPFSLAKVCSFQMHADFLKFGLLSDEEKCVWEPCQTIVLLGTVINKANSSVAATDKRIQSLVSDLDELLHDMLLFMLIESLL